LCNAESRCLSTTDFRRWSITISHNKQNSSPSSTWNIPVAYFLVQSGAVRLGGKELGTWNLASWSKKQRAFSLRFLSVALSVSFNWFSTKETTFCRKASNFAYFSSNKYQPFRLAYPNKGHLYVTPIGNSEWDSYQTPNMQNNALNFECLWNRRWQRFFSLLPK